MNRFARKSHHKTSVIRLLVAAALTIVFGGGASAEVPPNNPLRLGRTDFYGADPSVAVSADGRLFLFPTTDSHDWNKQFGWSCYSTTDLVDWTSHGVVFSAESSAWGTHKAWAPDIIRKDDRYYLFYYFNNGGSNRGGVGVAASDTPEGPYEELTPTRLCGGHDPAVFADDDGHVWLYLQDRVYEMNDDMTSFASGPHDVGLDYKPDVFEAAYVFKRGDTYYFTIAKDWNNIIYYTGDSPRGPFEYRGEIMRPYGGNNHHSVVEYGGRWILFYHEWLKGDPEHQRRLRAEYLTFNDDGSIDLVEPTDAGVTLAAADTRTPEGDEAGSDTREVKYLLGDEWMRDPFISLEDDGRYYMTGTRLSHTTGGVQGIEVWVSENLDDWAPAGVPWTFDNSRWIRSVSPPKGRTRKDFWLWAPELTKLADGRWIGVHTTNRRRANLIVSDGETLEATWSEPMGEAFGHRHDPSVFTDTDGSRWLVWGCAAIQKLNDDLTGFDGSVRRIGPSDRKLGHEGCVIRRIGKKYVLFGTAWSTDRLRDGTYNLYYCVADELTGPYGPRRFAGRFCGHGTPFEDKNGSWWTTAFLNGRFETDLMKGQAICDRGEAWTVNPKGMTLVPLDVTVAEDGDVTIRATPEPYASPGPEEVQAFDLVDASEAPTPRERTSAAERKAYRLFSENVRDPFIARGPGGSYCLTGTTAGSHWGKTVGVNVWRSDDLRDWDDLGFVWLLDSAGAEPRSWHWDRPVVAGVRNGRAVWAPELHHIDGTWWVPHSLNAGGHGLLRSGSGDVAGPYYSLPAVSNRGIDPHLFVDGGQVYYLWQNGNIVALDDSFRPVGSPRTIGPEGKHPLGYEGVGLIKVGTKYVLFASGRYGYETDDSYDLYYCSADSLYGPYGRRRVAVKHGGHGNLFVDARGDWWCTAFDHDFNDGETRWAPWIVPLDISETGEDLRISVLDPRFRPTAEDRLEVASLSRSGPPAEWNGRKPWWRPDGS
ncbi:MAG: family 43 glycosylhydrolase [Planctomycetota bacterium]